MEKNTQNKLFKKINSNAKYAEKNYMSALKMSFIKVYNTHTHTMYEECKRAYY